MKFRTSKHSYYSRHNPLHRETVMEEKHSKLIIAVLCIVLFVAVGGLLIQSQTLSQTSTEIPKDYQCLKDWYSCREVCKEKYNMVSGFRDYIDCERTCDTQYPYDESLNSTFVD